MRALRSSGGDHFLRSLKSGDHFMRALRSYGGYKRGSKDLQRILRSDPAMINEDHADFLDEENNELDRATRTSDHFLRSLRSSDHFMRALRSKDPYEHFLRSLRSANDLMRMVRSDSHFLRSLRSPTTNEEEEVVEAWISKKKYLFPLYEKPLIRFMFSFKAECILTCILIYNIFCFFFAISGEVL